MRILVFGGTGMLGHKLVQTLSGKFDVWSTIRGPYDDVREFGIFPEDRTVPRINAAIQDDLRRAIDVSHPDVVINCIGVVKQLPASKDIVKTLTLNSILPHRLHGMAAEYGYRLVLVSTDCVFSGQKGSYTEDDVPDASDLYGISKYLGEATANGCLTIRTSIIGRELTQGHSLVEWFLSNRGRTVKGFAKAIYSGFPTVVFADIIVDLLLEHKELSGVYHISSDPIDKFHLLSLMNDAYSAQVTIESSNDLVIDRSLDSTRFRKATGFEPRGWEEMISRMAADPTPYDDWRK